jgi:hypothetical protein
MQRFTLYKTTLQRASNPAERPEAQSPATERSPETAAQGAAGHIGGPARPFPSQSITAGLKRSRGPCSAARCHCRRRRRSSSSSSSIPLARSGGSDGRRPGPRPRSRLPGRRCGARPGGQRRRRRRRQNHGSSRRRRRRRGRQWRRGGRGLRRDAAGARRAAAAASGSGGGAAANELLTLFPAQVRGGERKGGGHGSADASREGRGVLAGGGPDGREQLERGEACELGSEGWGGVKSEPEGRRREGE